MNFPGRRLYPGNGTNLGAARDSGAQTKRTQSTRARGNTAADYNIKLRGLGRRIDRLPPRPWP